MAERFSLYSGPVSYGLRSAIVSSDQEMEGYARECVRLAQLANDPELRERLMQMAREWMAVAMHEERLPEPKSAVDD